MYKYLELAGSIAGILGMLVCLTAGLARIAGYFHISGYESTTLFNVGVGLMVFGCLVKLQNLPAQKGE
jgi:hypothetical protein